MNPRQKMLHLLLTKPMAREWQPPNAWLTWKADILLQLETLKDLAKQDWGKDAANKWNEPITLVQDWRGERDALIAMLEKQE